LCSRSNYRIFSKIWFRFPFSGSEDGKGATPLVELDAVVGEEDLLEILVDLDAMVSRIGHHDVPVWS